MARPASEFQVKETVPEIEKSCRADLAHFPDPTVQLQLQLQLAITAERYSEASRCELMSSKSNCGNRICLSGQMHQTYGFPPNLLAF